MTQDKSQHEKQVFSIKKGHNKCYNVPLYFYYFHIYIFIFSENIFIVRVINMFASLEKSFIPMNNAVYIY